jgi:hypothetical protein
MPLCINKAGFSFIVISYFIVDGGPMVRRGYFVYRGYFLIDTLRWWEDRNYARRLKDGVTEIHGRKDIRIE